jgi:hypothetical protein
MSQDRMPISRISGDFKFDGVVDDRCWDNIEPLRMVQHTPIFGEDPSEKSEVMICYDDHYLYLGARLFDSNPGEMRAASKKRDESQVISETLMLIIDSFNDKENAVVFSTTPTGLRADFSIANDAMNTSPQVRFLNSSWNTFWDVETTVDDRGWFAEMRIPLSSIRFKTENGKVVMGIIVLRRIAHKNEMNVFPAIPPNWGISSAYRPSKAQEVEFDGLVSKKPFYVTPYAIGGYQQDYIMNETATAYNLENEPKLNAGLDIKYGLTNNLTMDVTINTDFAQVEADDAQINLTRFSLSFPEKRTFFQERSSIFQFDFEEQSKLFYSRNIGLSGGRMVPILAGVRVTGMEGKWDMGFLDMQTGAVGDDIVSENFGIARIRRQVINQNSYVGGIVTSRLGMDGTYNVSYGVDGIFKMFENDYINVKAVQTMDDANTNDPLSLDATRLFFGWQRYSQKGLSYSATYSRAGVDSKSDMGFQKRRDYSFYSGEIGYGWIMGANSVLQQQTIDLNSTLYTYNESGEAQSAETSLSYRVTFKSGHRLNVYLSNLFENVADTFAISADAEVPSGNYNYNQLELRYFSSMSKPVTARINLTTGGYYDGTRTTAGIESTVSAGSSLQLSLEYSQNFIDFKARDQRFSAGIAGFKALYMFSTKLSLSSFVQYNGSNNDLTTNIRFRYNPREGNDFYIVLNDNRYTVLDNNPVNYPRFNNRAVLLKYTYTFIL